MNQNTKKHTVLLQGCDIEFKDRIPTFLPGKPQRVGATGQIPSVGASDVARVYCTGQCFTPGPVNAVCKMVKWGMAGPLEASIKMCFLLSGDYHIVWDVWLLCQHSWLPKEEGPNVEASISFEM